MSEPLAEQVTHRISRNILAPERYEVFADDIYIGAIREVDGLFQASRYTRGRVGVAPTLGGALDIVIAVGPEV